MDVPRASAIIPTHNPAAVRAGAVRRALAQRGVEVEVCVVDDGSEPPVALPRELAERVTLVRSGERQGAGPARNVALAATTAELVAFLDDDDVWLPEKL